MTLAAFGKSGAPPPNGSCSGARMCFGRWAWESRYLRVPATGRRKAGQQPVTLTALVPGSLCTAAPAWSHPNVSAPPR